MIGIASFLIFVAGMGLLARLGFKHVEAFPLWFKLKIGNWVIINLLFISLFKIKTAEYKAVLTGVILCLGWFAVWLAINKPV
jgi:hypothetical protein